MKHHLLALVAYAASTLAWANTDFKNVPAFDAEVAARHQCRTV